MKRNFAICVLCILFEASGALAQTFQQGPRILTKTEAGDKITVVQVAPDS